MIDDDRLATTVLAILESVRQKPKTFATEARRRGLSVDQLTAAAIVGVVREQLEKTADEER